MVEITEKEFKQFELLKKIFIHASPDKFEGVYFICGEGGEKDEMGLPEFISVCPAYGADGMAMYKNTKTIHSQDIKDG
jgi:hypothetical protein